MLKEKGVCPVHGEVEYYVAMVKRVSRGNGPEKIRQCMKCRADYKRQRRHECRRRLIEWMGGKCLMCGRKDRLVIHCSDSSPARHHWGIKRIVNEVLKGGVLLCYGCQGKPVPEEVVTAFHAGLRPFEFREHANAKLTSGQVKAIRADTISTNADLARLYGVAEKTIWYVRKGQRRVDEEEKH